MANNDREEESQFPFLKDETQLKSRIITPAAQSHFGSITQDLVLSNHEKEDVEFFRATENIIRFINVISMEGKVSQELEIKFQNAEKLREKGFKVSYANPFEEVALSYYDEMAILSNSTRGIKGQGVQMLFTQISRMFKRSKGEEANKRLGGVFGGNKPDDEDGFNG